MYHLHFNEILKNKKNKTKHEIQGENVVDSFKKRMETWKREVELSVVVGCICEGH